MTRIVRSSSPSGARGKAPPPNRTRVIHAAQLAAQREAEELLARARIEAEELVRCARASADALRTATLEEATQKAASLIATAEVSARARLEASEAELTDLGIGIAEKILAAELRLHPEQVTRIVAECLRRAVGARRILLRINPDDRSLVEEALAKLRDCADQSALVSLQPDPSIARGGCLLETEAGQVDGQISTQLAAVREALGR